MDAITKGRMQEHEFVQMTQRMNKLATAPIFLDDQAALNIFELRAKARRLKQKHDIKLIVIDYLQLMQGSIERGGNREQEISKISRDLKQLAKELEVPVIVLTGSGRAFCAGVDLKELQRRSLDGGRVGDDHGLLSVDRPLGERAARRAHVLFEHHAQLQPTEHVLVEDLSTANVEHDIEGRLRLRSFVWPDQIERLAYRLLD